MPTSPTARLAAGLIACFALFMSLTAGAATYHVAINHPSANDSNPGTEEQPWRSIQHAAATAVAGDLVQIHAGIYHEHVYLQNSGTAGAPIVFAAYPGDHPVLDGTGVTESQNGIIIVQQHVAVRGLEIRNWDECGIWIERAAFVEISDCEIHDVYCGIGMIEGAHDFVISRVIMHHFDMFGFDATPYGVDCYNITLNDCVSHTGRDAQQNVDGFAIGHGAQHDIVLNRCETYNVYDGFDIGENLGGTDINIVLNRCVSHECWNDGIKITGGATVINCLSYENFNANVAVYWDQRPGTVTLHSSTFMDAETFNVWVENSADVLRMHNCIVAGGDNIGLGFEQRDVSTYTGDYNLFQNDNADRAVNVGYEDEFSLAMLDNGDWTSYSGQDAHSRIVTSCESVFLDPAGRDFRLNQSCLAVDNGTPVGAPTEDIDGNPRPRGAGYDIGAYEYQGPVGLGESPDERRPVAAAHLLGSLPNPFSEAAQIRFMIDGYARAVTLKVFDMLGRECHTLIDDVRGVGVHDVRWDGRNAAGVCVPGGVYFYQLRTSDGCETEKLLLLR